MTNDEYEPPTTHAYHIELNDENIDQLVETGDLEVVFDPLTDEADDVEFHITYSGDGGEKDYRVDGVVR